MTALTSLSSRQGVRAFGGPSALGGGVSDKCLKHMQAWWETAKTVASAKFPHFEAIRAFNV